MIQGSCELCHKPLQNSGPVWERIEHGYLEPRSAGGPNQCKFPRKVPGGIVHKTCAELYEKRGRQGSLLDSPQLPARSTSPYSQENR